VISTASTALAWQDGAYMPAGPLRGMTTPIFKRSSINGKSRFVLHHDRPMTAQRHFFGKFTPRSPTCGGRSADPMHDPGRSRGPWAYA
jgi:hypothetical protein